MTESWRFAPILLRVLKILGIAMIILFLIISIVSWVVTEKKNEWLVSEIQSYMNESQSGQLEIASTNIKIFRNFPDVTIEFDSVQYYEHHDTVRVPGEKPILIAAELFVAIKLLPLINNELIISDISLTNAKLNIVKYKSGKLNVELALASPVKPKPTVAQKKVSPKPSSTTKPSKDAKPKKIAPPPKAGIQIDLESVSLSQVELTWSLYNKKRPSVILLEELELDLANNENIIYVGLTTACKVKRLNINRTSIPTGNLTADLDLQFDQQKQQLTIQKSEINYNELTTTLQGTYSHRKNHFLDLEVDASSNDLEFLSMFIKREVLKQNPGLLKQVDVYAKGKIVGELKAPQVDVTFGLKDLDLNLPRNLGTLKDIGFDGHFVTGDSTDYSQAKLEIKDIRGQLPGGFVKGSFSLNNFVEPYLAYALEAELKLDGYDEVFNLSSLKQLTGSVSLEANFDGPLKYLKQHTIDSSRSSTITLNDLSFIVTKTNKKVSGLSGKIENRINQTSIQELGFNYGDNDLLMNVTANNLMHYFLTSDTLLVVSGNIHSKQLYTKDFIVDTLRSADVQDRITNLSFNFHSTIAENDSLEIPNITFDIQNLSATLEKLPDLKLVNAKGRFSMPDSVLKLDLHEFHATLPQGKIDISGDLIIPHRTLYVFNAHLNSTSFPWTYIQELIAEIQQNKEPHAKNLPVTEMDLATAELDISASIITYPFDLAKVNIRNSKINYTTSDKKNISVNKLNIDLENLLFEHPKNSGLITGLKSTKGTVSLKQLKVAGLNELDLNMNITGKNDSLDIAFSSASQVATSEHGNLFMDISKKERSYQLQYIVTGSSLEIIGQKFYKKEFMKGKIDYSINLHATGATMPILKKNMAGEIKITGDSINLSGVDVDKVLRRFERSQNFNLTDVGAVLIAGPIGLAVTKGSDFVSLATVNLNPKHHTLIKELNTTWKLEAGQLITEDVAFATSENRVAFNGIIDFARDTIPGLTIAVVDKNGCSLMDQRLYGKTNDLKTGKLKITKTVFGSVINFVNAMVGKDCKPVYTGKVKPPL